MIHPRFNTASIPVILESSDDVRFHVDLARLALESSFFQDLADLPSYASPSQDDGSNIIPLPFCSKAIEFMLDCTQVPMKNIALLGHFREAIPFTTAIIGDILDIGDAYDMPKVVDRLYERLNQDKANRQWRLVVTAARHRPEDNLPLDFAQTYFDLAGQLDDWTTVRLSSLTPSIYPQLDQLRLNMEEFQSLLKGTSGSTFGMRCRECCIEAVEFKHDFAAFRLKCLPGAWASYMQVKEGNVTKGYLRFEVESRCNIRCHTCRNRVVTDILKILRRRNHGFDNSAKGWAAASYTHA